MLIEYPFEYYQAYQKRQQNINNHTSTDVTLSKQECKIKRVLEFENILMFKNLCLTTVLLSGELDIDLLLLI